MRMVAVGIALLCALAACPKPEGQEPDASVVTPDAPGVSGDECDPYATRSPTPQLIVGPLNWENTLLSKIAGTTEQLDVMIYELTRPSFIDAIIAAHNRGVAVRVIIDRENTKNANTWTTLTSAGVPVKDAPTAFRYYHIKALIFDRKEAIVMSANLVWAHFEITRNYSILESDPADVADLVAIADADWNGTQPNLTCTRLIVTPVNARARVMDLIKNAKTSLLIAAMYVKDDDVRDAIAARKAAGVDVRALLPDPAWIADSPMDATWFQSVGVPVKYFKKYDLHAKLIIADDVAFVGSNNYSYTSLTYNREAGVFITDQTPMSAAKTQFEADWNVGFAAP